MQPEGINPISHNLFSSANLNSNPKDLDPLVKLISTRLGVSEFTALRVLRKYLGTGQAGTFSDFESFLVKFLEDPSNTRQLGELAKDLQALQKNPNAQEQNFKPVIERLKYGLLQSKQVQSQPQTKANVLAEGDRFFAANQAKITNTNPATQLVQSPKLFASWLVNNKAAFIALRSNPQVANLLLAMQNPRINQSPVMMSQIAALISQLLRLKQGKSLTEEKDEIRKEKLDRKHQMEFTDEELTKVGHVKGASAGETVGALRDFLLEAERFAEEEIANLWSLTLKKEKELENKLKSGFEKFKKKHE